MSLKADMLLKKNNPQISKLNSPWTTFLSCSVSSQKLDVKNIHEIATVAVLCCVMITKFALHSSVHVLMLISSEHKADFILWWP